MKDTPLCFSHFLVSLLSVFRCLSPLHHTGFFFFFGFFHSRVKQRSFFFFSPGALDEATREHIRRLKLHLFSIEKKSERERAHLKNLVHKLSFIEEKEKSTAILK